MMQQPKTPGGKLQKTWEFVCNFKEGYLENDKALHETSGGNVCELPGNNIFE